MQPQQHTQRDVARAGRTAYRLTGMSHDQVVATMRDYGRQIAEELTRHGIPVPSKRHRPDVGHVQIDTIVIQEKVSHPEPGIRIAFDVEGDLGVTFTVKLLELLEDPAEYLRNLLNQLGPMRRNMMRRRRDRKALDAAFYKALTQGAN